MRSTVLKQFIAFALFSSTSGILFAQSLPRILHDPLLELGYEQAKIRFEPLPLQAIAGCDTLSDNEYSVGVHFVFAKASDNAGRIFYLLHGYEIRNNPEPPHSPKYSTSGHGLIVTVRGPECLVIDNDARETFRSPVFNDEYPQDIHQRLAIDFAARLSSAFGGKEKLRAQILKQRVDLDMLPDELRHAFRDLRLPK
jgi:hypothetical protein